MRYYLRPLYVFGGEWKPAGIAAIILEELEDKQRWDEAFSYSPDKLAKLAAKAMAEFHARKTQELDPETL
jgi:hypothetical protein